MVILVKYKNINEMSAKPENPPSPTEEEKEKMLEEYEKYQKAEALKKQLAENNVDTKLGNMLAWAVENMGKALPTNSPLLLTKGLVASMSGGMNPLEVSVDPYSWVLELMPSITDAVVTILVADRLKDLVDITAILGGEAPKVGAKLAKDAMEVAGAAIKSAWTAISGGFSGFKGFSTMIETSTPDTPPSHTGRIKNSNSPGHSNRL